MAANEVKEKGPCKQFISGVVEGFYGKPWSPDQRCNLFARLQKMGLNTYMYAPKDDIKHRRLWREQYTNIEGDNLKSLIQASESHGIQFVYAISPGLDIIFSCPKEIEFLKSKMKQVEGMGCKHFALLFDDIEPELSLPDRDEFDSFGEAQVKISNDVYEFLNKPKVFLFCPTEYCASRAKPNVQNSDYLKVIGNKLHLGIDIMWTGPKVVSKRISTHSVQVLSNVLKRKPVLWDNIHANDYDQRRVFLGPYHGRPTNLYKHLNGILTNPNCEYECNFVAIHTLSTWISDAAKEFDSTGTERKDLKGENKDLEETEDMPAKPEPMESSPSPDKPKHDESEDENMLEESKDLEMKPVESSVDSKLSDNAIRTNELEPMDTASDTEASAVDNEPQPPPETDSDKNVVTENLSSGVKDLSSDSKVTTDSEPKESVTEKSREEVNEPVMPKQIKLEAKSASPSHKVILDTADLGSYDPQNALEKAILAWLDEFKVIKDIASTGTAILNTPTKLVIDQNVNSLVSPIHPEKITEDHKIVETDEQQHTDEVCSETDSGSEQMEEDKSCCRYHPTVKDISPKKKAKHSSISLEDLTLLSDLFYLPYDHGERGKQLIGEFKWLKNNVILDTGAIAQTSRRKKEWETRANAFHKRCQEVSDLFVRLSETPNRVLLQEIFPYIWDVKEVVMLLDAFVKWLGKKDRKQNSFVSEDPEPWLFRGGIAEELERLLPIHGGNDILTSSRGPGVHNTAIFTIRPYLPSDKAAVYDVCSQTCDDGHDGRDMCPNYPDLSGDRFVGAYLQLSSGVAFVMEDEDGVCGYCVATSDAQQFYKQYKEEWLPSIREKYVQPTGERQDWSHEDELIDSIHVPKIFLPDELYSDYKAHISINMLPRAKGTSIGKRMLTCILSVLKAEGASGVYCEISATNTNAVEFYSELGFCDVPMITNLPENILVFGRKV